MSLFVREIDWMWNDLHLSLAECRVYAYIHGLTHGERKGYHGSKRGLAKALGLSEKSVRENLNTLMERNLISYTDGMWQSESRTGTDTADSARTNADSVRENADSVRSPQTPLYNNINNKKQADMQTNLFEKVFRKFEPKFKNRLAATNLEWDKRSDAAQQAMYDAVKDEPDGSITRNPYFFVQDFPDPQPQFLRGDEGGDLVQVKYGDRIKICTRATMELFGLEWVRDWNC